MSKIYKKIINKLVIFHIDTINPWFGLNHFLLLTLIEI